MAAQFIMPLFEGVAEAALDCARHSHPPNPERAETRSCPRRAYFPINQGPSKLACSLFWKDTHVGPSAAVERGPSEGARSGSTGPMCVSFHFLHRAQSASTKDTWPLPSPHFNVSRFTFNFPRRIGRHEHEDFETLVRVILHAVPFPGRRHRLLPKAQHLLL
jgi:hypothetical protein